MIDQWYCAWNQKKCGPFTLHQLCRFAKAGRLLPSEMILHADSQKWVSAGSIVGIFPPQAASIDPELRTLDRGVRSESIRVQSAEVATPALPIISANQGAEPLAGLSYSNPIRVRHLLVGGAIAVCLMGLVLGGLVIAGISQIRTHNSQSRTVRAELNTLKDPRTDDLPRLPLSPAEPSSSKLEQELNEARAQAKIADEQARAAEERASAEKANAEKLQRELDVMMKLLAEKERPKRVDTAPTIKPSFKVPAAVDFPITEERLDIDPALHGIWDCHAISKDKGKTATPAYVQGFVRVTALTVQMPGKPDMVVDKVVICTTDSGDPCNLIRFKNGTIWAVSKRNLQPYVLVQKFDDLLIDEEIRIVVTVHR